ncbi:hypothetical protein Tsubulata_006327, partial [Turnera subulata]
LRQLLAATPLLHLCSLLFGALCRFLVGRLQLSSSAPHSPSVSSDRSSRAAPLLPPATTPQEVFYPEEATQTVSASQRPESSWLLLKALLGVWRNDCIGRSQNSSTADARLLVPSKRDKKSKRSAAQKLAKTGQAEKRNNNCVVGKRVQKNDADEHKCELEKIPDCSKFGAALKKGRSNNASSEKRNNCVVWKRVQKNDADEYKCELEKVHVSSKFDGLKQDHSDYRETAWLLDNLKLVASDSVTSESKLQTLSSIAQGMNDSCSVPLASDVVRMNTGCPIAEFEKLLHLFSPVICLSHNVLSRQAYSQDKVELLKCRLEKPDIRLECLWDWYERHGNYGLRVRAENHEKSKGIGVDCFSFCAYFVPFFSAVQLFKCQRSQAVVCKNETGACGVVTETCETAETSGDSDFGIELLFEYFESDQPHERRPLYEKIQELAGGSECKMYGDPFSLLSVNVQNLHPRSWYSVAWYPIYSIPDGNLHAAFLTYHSLGDLMPGTIKSNSTGVDVSVACPVVGLLSYNSQSECWFQFALHGSARETPEDPSGNPSGSLKERLRTLEETASLMSRAAVKKRNVISVNRHPDFEFFLSRQG